MCVTVASCESPPAPPGSESSPHELAPTSVAAKLAQESQRRSGQSCGINTGLADLKAVQPAQC